MAGIYYRWGNPPLKYCRHCERPYWGWVENCSLNCEMEFLLQDEWLTHEPEHYPMGEEE